MTKDPLKAEWDPTKAALNLAKHGVSFATAIEAFFDPAGLVIEDPEPIRGEARLVLLGMTWSGALLVVVHTFDHATGVIRIISARRATAAERKQYGKRS